MKQLTTKPLTWFRPDPGQPRKHFDPADLKRLGESLRVRQLQPVLAKPCGQLIAGERRWRAAQAEGLDSLLVIVTEEALSDSEIRQVQIVENMQRADLSGYEQWTACAELMCMNPGWMMKDLAEHLHLDPSTVTRILSPSKLDEAWQNALRDGKVSISDAYAASKVPPENRAGLLALKLSGASRDKLEEVARKTRRGVAAQVKLARVRCPLSTGTVVTVQGPEMDLEQLIEALQGALDAARKANKESLDVRTAERVWKDRAKAG